MSNVSFVAIDPSISATGVSRISKSESSDLYKVERVDTVTCGSRRFPNRWEKKVKMSLLFKNLIETHYSDCKFAVFENYSYGSPGQLADLGEMNGLFKYILSANNIPFETITPNEVKKIITGKGNADKDLVQKSVEKFMEKKIVFKGYDESDSVAVGIAYAIKMRGIINES